MSIQSEINRIRQNVQDTVTVFSDAGISMPETVSSDQLPGLAQTLVNTKQDKLTGTAGQFVGFDADGNASPVNFDTELSSTSENPVQNKAIYEGLNGKAEKALIITLTLSNDNYVSDISYNDAYNAYTTGRDVKLKYNNILYDVWGINSHGMIFRRIDFVGFSYVEFIYIQNFDTWTRQEEIIVADNQNYGVIKANTAATTDTIDCKINSDGFLKVDQAALDTAIDNKLGPVETALNAIINGTGGTT